MRRTMPVKTKGDQRRKSIRSSVDLKPAAQGASEQAPSDPLVIGKIGQPFGVRGWVRVMSFCAPQDNIVDYDSWWLRHQDSGFLAERSGMAPKRIGVLEIKPHGKGFVASLAGLTDRDEALALRGWEIVIDRASLPSLSHDDFYWHQLEGMTVKSVSGENLGTLVQMLETGANDVMVVRPNDASFDNRKRLIPYRYEAVVKSVDLQAAVVLVDWDLDF